MDQRVFRKFNQHWHKCSINLLAVNDCLFKHDAELKMQKIQYCHQLIGLCCHWPCQPNVANKSDCVLKNCHAFTTVLSQTVSSNCDIELTPIITELKSDWIQNEKWRIDFVWFCVTVGLIMLTLLNQPGKISSSVGVGSRELNFRIWPKFWFSILLNFEVRRIVSTQK